MIRRCQALLQRSHVSQRSPPRPQFWRSSGRRVSGKGTEFVIIVNVPGMLVYQQRGICALPLLTLTYVPHIKSCIYLTQKLTREQGVRNSMAKGKGKGKGKGFFFRSHDSFARHKLNNIVFTICAIVTILTRPCPPSLSPSSSSTHTRSERIDIEALWLIFHHHTYIRTRTHTYTYERQISKS